MNVSSEKFSSAKVKQEFCYHCFLLLEASRNFPENPTESTEDIHIFPSKRSFLEITVPNIKQRLSVAKREAEITRSDN